MRTAPLALVLIAGAAHAQPEPIVQVGPQREGVTLEIGGGLGVVRVFAKDGTVQPGGDAGFSIGGIDVGIGAFPSPAVALMFRFSGDTGWESLPTTNHIRANVLATAAGQWWFEDRAFVGGGFGLAIVGGQDQEGANDESTYGLGASLRGGWAVALYDDSAWTIGGEITASLFFDDRRSYSGTLLLSWQSF